MNEDKESEFRAQIVANECNGIQPPHLVFYISSICYSANQCIQAFESYFSNKNLNEPDKLFAYLQDATTHAAALSRYFWPAPKKQKDRNNFYALQLARGKNLAVHFNLSQTSALYNREFRNAWEHFDERIDEYLLSNTSGQFYPNCIVHRLDEIPNNSYTHFFKLLCPDEDFVILLGQPFHFLPIYQEVKYVLKICNLHLKNPS